MAKMLKGKAELLCDDRVIVRRWPDGFRVHGTWSHGEIPEVSSNSAPLKALMFLKQAPHNRLIPMDDRREILGRVLACLVKPLETVDWWERMLDLVKRVASSVPCYTIEFDKSGRVIDLFSDL